MIKLPRELLDRSPEETARRLCLALWDEAGTALARLEAGDDTEALHDFRVALRRLRSVLRAYRRYLRGSRPGKLRRLVGALASSTNLARDVEVQLAWLEARDGDAAERLHAHLASKRIELPTPEALRKHFTQVARPLVAGLGRMRLVTAADDGARSFLTATGVLLTERGAVLKAGLGSVASSDEAEKLHRARIEAKRLRYLLEPLVEVVGRVKPLIKKMKGLQDCLGELQDTQVLTETIAASLEGVALDEARRLRDEALGRSGRGSPAEPEGEPERSMTSAGLFELLEAQRGRREEAFSALERTWLGDSGRPFFEGLGALADELVREAKKTKQYLLSGLPDAVSETTARPTVVHQGFLPGKIIVEHVRSEKRGRRVRYVRAVASEEGLKEEPLTRAAFEVLWPLTEGRRLERRVYEADGATIHAVEGKNVVLADTRTPPEWLEPFIVREVTGAKRYAFETLALTRARSAPRRSRDPRGESR